MILKQIVFLYLVILTIGTVAANARLTVTQTLESPIAIVAANVTFRCIFSPSDNSAVTVEWWKLGENEFLQPGSDSRKRFLTQSGEASLQLLSVNLQDSAAYYCGVRYRGRGMTNGTGSSLVVHAPPMQPNIVSDGNSTTSLTLVCETDGFYPEDISVTWYKDDKNVFTVNKRKQLGRDGRGYQVSSSLEETQPVRSGAVYICVVSHLSLKSPIIAIYSVPVSKQGTIVLFL
ncbi:tapasin-related protein-like [Callorhinchus milii]|uniref:tapasin-related protein-like n=1 Tax=Callorhinchus milii TaxID=7868 RepID=UPI001C3FED4A|nr:tapasin-related protein-like [Callorhinchus milii]